MNFQTYYCNKDLERVAKSGHFWMYSKKLSSAKEHLKVPSIVKLLSADKKVLGYAIHEPMGIVAMRVLKNVKEGTIEEIVENFKAKIQSHKIKPEGAGRLINGEADGFPGLTVDYYSNVVVIQPFLNFWMGFMENFTKILAEDFNFKGVLLKPGRRGTIDTEETKVLFGEVPKEISFHEDQCTYISFPFQNHKTGFYLDLEKLRAKLKKYFFTRKVANLFANTGSLSILALKQEASSVLNIEASPNAKELAKKQYEANQIPFLEENWKTEDAFEWLEKNQEKFDLLIFDPPQLCSQKKDVPKGLNVFKKSAESAKKALNPKGLLVVVNCTSLIPAKDIEKEILPGFKILEKGGLPSHHTVDPNFPEGDYLKWWILEKL